MKREENKVVTLLKRLYKTYEKKEADPSEGNFLREIFEDGCETEEEKEKLGEIKIVDKYGGEGKGSTYYVVAYFPLHETYLKLDGWYQSYNGVEFDGFDSLSIVTPVEKTITVYESIK